MHNKDSWPKIKIASKEIWVLSIFPEKVLSISPIEINFSRNDCLIISIYKIELFKSSTKNLKITFQNLFKWNFNKNVNKMGKYYSLSPALPLRMAFCAGGDGFYPL